MYRGSPTSIWHPSPQPLFMLYFTTICRKSKTPHILYCDSDSIIYVHDSHYMSETPDIPTGSYLGELTNELPDDVDVDSFYSSGPKFYSISGKKLSNVKKFNNFKVKGITINRCVENFFDQNAFKNLVLAETHSLRSPFHSSSVHQNRTT